MGARAIFVMARQYEILKSIQDVERFRLWTMKDGYFEKTKYLDSAEKTFALLMVAIGYYVQHSIGDQDKFEHWDWKVIDHQNSKYTLVDVKGAKKEFRKDLRFNYDLCSNELQNVRGNDGWLKGKSHKIALVLKNEVLCFDTKELRKWTENKIQGKQITDENKRGVYYEPYQRSKWGKEDICVKSKISDMKKDLKYSEYSLDMAS